MADQCKRGERLKIQNTFYNVGFGLLCAILFYLMPCLAWHTMEGDKTDILMGMVLGVIPIGLLLLSVFYGFLAERIIIPTCIASILSIPAIFISVVAGDTAIERLLALVFLSAVIIIIVCPGTALGILIRRLLRKCNLNKTEMEGERK